MRTVYTPGELTGGTASSLDSISESVLSDGDLAFVAEADGSGFYVLKYNASSTAATSSPSYIRPLDYSSSGVWENQSSPFGSQTPVGSIIAMVISTVPDGYLECDGSAVSRTVYSSLFSAIGTTYGSGDGSTTFNIPDYRGRVLRGWDHGAGVDPDAASRTDRGDGTTGDVVGSKQDGQNEAHTHTNSTTYCPSNPVPSNHVVIDANICAGTLATSSSGGAEARMININAMFCIKY